MTQCRKSNAFHRSKEMAEYCLNFWQSFVVTFGCTYFLKKGEEINNDKIPLKRSVFKKFENLLPSENEVAER